MLFGLFKNFFSQGLEHSGHDSEEAWPLDRGLSPFPGVHSLGTDRYLWGLSREEGASDPQGPEAPQKPQAAVYYPDTPGIHLNLLI